MIIVPAVGYDLWFFPESLDFGDSTSTGFVAALPPETVILKAAYVDRADQGRLDQARQRIATRESWGREDIYLLRPTPASDGPPF